MFSLIHRQTDGIHPSIHTFITYSYMHTIYSWDWFTLLIDWLIDSNFIIYLYEWYDMTWCISITYLSFVCLFWCEEEKWKSCWCKPIISLSSFHGFQNVNCSFNLFVFVCCQSRVFSLLSDFTSGIWVSLASYISSDFIFFYTWFTLHFALLLFYFITELVITVRRKKNRSSYFKKTLSDKNVHLFI